MYRDRRTSVGASGAAAGASNSGSLLFYALIVGVGFALAPIGYSIAYALNANPVPVTATDADAAVCEAGQGGADCVACAAGTFSAGGSFDECAACAENTYAAAGASACTACPEGCDNDPPGTCNVTTGACTACENGYGGAGCVVCEDGTYSVSNTTDNCTACPVGCAIDPGNCARATGICSFCEPGYGTDNCTVCAAGSFSLGGDLEACSVCVAGCNDTVLGNCSATTGDCTSCEAGYGGAACAACASGTWSAGGTLAACAACPVECNTTCAVTTGVCPTTGCPNGTATNTVAAVNLGSAANFAILASSAITGTADATITGDIGLSPAVGTFITGFPTTDCNFVTGTIYTVGATATVFCEVVNTTLLTAAHADLVTAYNEASLRPANYTLNAANNQLGSQTLIAGVYAVSAASSFNLEGTLTLDAQGDSSAVWVFQMASTLLTQASSVIQLTNCAQACNVFWQLGTAATLGASSVFVGTIMAGSAITLNTGAVINGGRALTSEPLGTFVTLTGANAISVPVCA